jgi:hypothetical protein
MSGLKLYLRELAWGYKVIFYIIPKDLPLPPYPSKTTTKESSN